MSEILDDKPFAPPEPSAQGIPVADVAAPVGQTGGTVSQTFVVKVPENDAQDFIVQMRASTLQRCRDRLQKINSSSFPWAEVLLAGASLFLGAWLSALTTDTLKPGTFPYHWYFQLCPIVGFSLLVAFFLRRYYSSGQATDHANEVLKELPDPKNM